MTSPPERVTTWLADSTAEDQHFDIKQTLSLAARNERKELLKDLTGMGNGGGGTIAFGIAERVVGSDAVADRVVELSDRTLVGRLADLIANAVRPTLRWFPTVVDRPSGGYVLIVDVERSPLGPYMVDAYDDHRYWRRVHTSTMPMDERLVHDLYAEAVRWASQRDAVWAQVQLPLAPTWSSRPWLTASGIPEMLLGEPFDPATRPIVDLAYGRQDTEHARIAGLDDLASKFTPWGGGFIAEANAERGPGSYPPGPQTVVRLHRNGVIGVVFT